MRAQHIWNTYANYQQALDEEVNKYTFSNSRWKTIPTSPYQVEEYPIIESQLVVSLDVKIFPFDYQPDGKTVFDNRGKYKWIQHQIALDNSRHVWFFAIDDVDETDVSKKPSGKFEIAIPGSVKSDSHLYLQGAQVPLGNTSQTAGKWKHDYFSIENIRDCQPSNDYIIFFAGQWFFHQRPYSSADCNLTIYKLLLTGKYVPRKS